MMLILRRLTPLLLLLVAGSGHAVILDALIAGMPDSAAVRVLTAQQQGLAAEYEQRADELGWSLFGGADTGYFRELQASGDPDTYTGYGASVGLRYPLLGTLEERQQALTEAQLAMSRQDHATMLRRSDQRALLRQSYIDWWHAWRLTRWCVQWRPLADAELDSARQRASH